jgi:hypothetical protein
MGGWGNRNNGKRQALYGFPFLFKSNFCFLEGHAVEFEPGISFFFVGPAVGTRIIGLCQDHASAFLIPPNHLGRRHVNFIRH